jgi:hypothetical protein
MMIPHVSPPVNRRLLFETAQRQIKVPGVAEPEQTKKLWQLVLGANPDPNEPQRFLYPVSCQEWCTLFSGFSLVACLAMCRR